MPCGACLSTADLVAFADEWQRQAVIGEQHAAGVAWADALLHTFKLEGYAAAREQQLAWRTLQHGKKRQVAERLLNDVVERREMVSDPEFTARGWHLVTGPTEARGKSSISRLRPTGQRWHRPHAEAIAPLTNLRDRDQWPL
jgi:hypothetical protein